eukprot:3723286-Rhodomonas_salina.1
MRSTICARYCSAAVASAGNGVGGSVGGSGVVQTWTMLCRPLSDLKMRNARRILVQRAVVGQYRALGSRAAESLYRKMRKMRRARRRVGSRPTERSVGTTAGHATAPFCTRGVVRGGEFVPEDAEDA